MKLQWNTSKTGTTGTKNFVCCSEVSVAQRLVTDNTPHLTVANCVRIRLKTMIN